MTDLDALNKAVQAAPGANASVKAWIAAATPILEPATPPAAPAGGGSAPAASGGVGLYSLGNGPQGFTHLTDDTYSLVIGPWPSLSFLNTLAMPTMVYTVVAGTPGATDPPYTLLDPTNPAAYVAAVKAYVAGTKVGVFCDNALLEMAGLPTAIQSVGTQLRAAGIPFGINLGGYVAGNPDSDTGVLWQQRVAQVGPYCAACMLENWQQFSGGPLQGQPRTDANGGNWTSWQNCPGAAVKAGTQIVAVTYGGEPNLTYGRASLLLAPGAGSDAVFATGADTNTDPYDPTWTTKTPHPVVNPDGTASL